MASTNGEWKVLAVPRSELNLRVTLLCGQSFRWREIGSQTWAGVLNNSIVTLKQEDGGADHILYKFHSSSPSSSSSSSTNPATVISSSSTTTSPSSTITNKDKNEEDILRDYFQLSHSLASLYPVWASTGHSINEEFKKSAAGLVGVRILRQPPLECLYSFICSSNNNISRITKMVESLCVKYGTLLGEVGGQKFYSFPSLSQLESVDEATLRDLGFGENEKGWLEEMRGLSREVTQTRLVSLMGVGRKVADCVALFSLDKLDVVPVDTHILQVAQRHMPELKKKGKGKGSLTLTPALYESIGSFFRERFGNLAGWAHTVLFAGDLAKFQVDVINANIKMNDDGKDGNTLKKETEEAKEEKKEEEDDNEKENDKKGKRKGKKTTAKRKPKRSKN